jgi:hypothetical protein
VSRFTPAMVRSNRADVNQVPEGGCGVRSEEHASPQTSPVRQKIQMDMVEQLLVSRTISTEAGLQLLIEMVGSTLGRSLHTRGHVAPLAYSRSATLTAPG